MTVGQFLILAGACGGLATALLVRLLLYGVMRRAILAYWDRHPQPASVAWQRFKWLPAYGIFIAVVGVTLLYLLVLRHL